MSGLTLEDIRACLEGAVPSIIATCAADGTPNVAYLSQVYYAGPSQVALSFQFFSKTRHNILANPVASLLLLHPQTAAYYRLTIRYQHTLTQGALFESMRAQLAGIASHEGMADVFALRGSDIYDVLAIEAVPGATLGPGPPPKRLLGPVRRCSAALSRCTSLDMALQCVMATLGDELDIRHAMVFLLDPATQRLYNVISSGYAQSGVGTEIDFGQGVIGIAAQARTPVRIAHVTGASLYSHAIRRNLDAHDAASRSTDIPYPGLAQPQSQVAVPLLSADGLIGVLFAESAQELRFDFEDEDALVALAGHLAATIELLRQAPVDIDATPPPPAEPLQSDLIGTIRVRRYRSNNSIFLDGHYLIKGVAGAIFWKLLAEFRTQGRCDFTNRELRLDQSIGLPDVVDNLEARLILLERRLAEQALPLRLQKTGRGQFRLCVGAPVDLIEVD